MTAPPERVTMPGAACTVYRDAPSWNERRTAAVGEIAFDSVARGTELLTQVCASLDREGFDAVIGPMNGDTWHSYRLVLDSDGSPPFPMEPVSGPHDREAFEAAGFEPISRYESTRASLVTAIGDGPPFEPEGLIIRAWDGSDPDGFIRRLFAMSAGSFARAAFFKPISEASFRALYEPMVAALDPRLVLFALTTTGELVGFLYGYENRFEGTPARTVVLKTYASARPGAGRALVDRFHRTARDLGYTQVVHALMREDNTSRARSALHGAQPFRRYAVMGRRRPA